MCEDLTIHSGLTGFGDIWGLKFPEKRPAFEIRNYRNHDTLTIITPKEFSPKTIGVSTYGEKIVNIIRIPAGKKVIVQEASCISVEDSFLSLMVSKADELTAGIAQSSVKTMVCHSETFLKINRKAVPQDYKLEGKGSNVYNFTAQKINVNFR